MENFDKELEINTTESEPVQPETKTASKGKKGGAVAEVYDWFDTLICSVLAIIVIFAFVTRLSSVDGRSMFPTLEHEEKLLITDMFYTPANNDIVVLWADKIPSDDGTGYGKAIVKRVVGVAGDTIKINFTAGVVYRNGEALPLEVSEGILYEDGHMINDYTTRKLQFDLQFGEEVTIPDGYIFVLGDNRNESLDSRGTSVGLVDVNNIIGKAYLRVWPLDKFGGLV